MKWSPTEGIRWATAIPGNGHSSPVVFDDRVYVTTAYTAEHGGIWKNALSGLELGLVTLLSLLILHTIVQLCRTDANGFRRVWYLGTAWAYGLIIVVLLLLYTFGASALDYDRCIIRSWLGSSIVVSLCLLLAVSQTPPASRWCIAGAATSMLFAVYVVLGMPARDHAFRFGPYSTAAAVVWATVSIPCLVGLMGILNYRFSRPAFVVPGRSPDPRGSRTAVIAQCALVSLTVLGVTLLGVFMIRARLEPYLLAQEFEEIRVSSRSAVSGWILGALIAGTCFLFLGLASHLPKAPPPAAGSRSVLMRRFAIVGGGVVLCLTGGGILLAAIVKGSGFFTYHLANPRWMPESGISSIVVLVGLCLLYCVIQVAPAKLARFMSFSAQPAVRAVALAFGASTFVTTNFISSQTSLVRAIVCLDRYDGRTLWVRDGLPGPEGQLHKENSPASPTPVIGEGRMYAYFGAQGVMCTDLDGNLEWVNQQEEVLHQSAYGASISPIFSDGMVVIVNPALDQASICALDGTTGAMLWKAPLKGMRPPHILNRPPVLATVAGRKALLYWDLEGLTAYAPRTGAELWSCPIGAGLGDHVASPVYDDERIYLVGIREATALRLADLPTAKNTEEAVAWRMRVTGANCSSPVLSQGLLFMVTDNGVGSCLDARTGETLWRQRFVGQHYASPVIVGKYVYFTNLDGVTTVVAAEPQYHLVAQADLGERMYASFALLDDCLIARTLEHVVCITGSSGA
ncbi:MAG: outer membrane protein assembly factor BamB family protein, partial [Planctomycetota bacterium]